MLCWWLCCGITDYSILKDYFGKLDFLILYCLDYLPPTKFLFPPPKQRVNPLPPLNKNFCVKTWWKIHFSCSHCCSFQKGLEWSKSLLRIPPPIKKIPLPPANFPIHSPPYGSITPPPLNANWKTWCNGRIVRKYFALSFLVTVSCNILVPPQQNTFITVFPP